MRKGTVQFRLSMLLVSCVVVILAGMISVASISLHKKRDAYDEQLTQLEEELEKEKTRSEEIEEFEDYVGTDQYVEDVAKDKLGLAYPGEILIIPE